MFRALDDEIEIRTPRRGGSLDGEDRGNAGLRGPLGPHNAGPGVETAGRHGPSEPQSAGLIGTLPRTGIPSRPFQPARPGSLPGPRDMSEEWVTLPLGTVRGLPTGPLPQSVIPDLGTAPGEQWPDLASERHTSSLMVTTAGAPTVQFTTTALNRGSANDPSSLDTRSLTGYVRGPHPLRLQDAGPAVDAGPAGNAGLSDGAVSRSQSLAGTISRGDRAAGRPSASTRDVSPFQRQHSVVRRPRHVSPAPLLIDLEDDGQHEAVTYREQSPEVDEARSDRVWGRTPGRPRRQPRGRASTRRRHRRRRDSSESSDSDDNRRSMERHAAPVMVPRRGRESDHGHGSELSQRSTARGRTPSRVAVSSMMPTTDQPSAAHADYGGGMTTPVGPHSSFMPDRSPEFVRGVSGVQGTYPSDGWVGPVTSSWSAVLPDQRTVPSMSHPYVGTPAGTYTIHSSGHRAGSVHELAHHYQSSTGQRSTTSDRGTDHPPGRGPPPSGPPPVDDRAPPTNVADSSTEMTTGVDVARRRHIANVGVKLGTYDGNSCLETFLASLRNFATYFKWSEEDELFHLRASLKGPAGQLLWDLGSNVTLAELVRLLRNRFGTSNQAERFRAELRTRKRKPGEQLQKLYNDICRLMSLAYPGPSSEIVNVVGREAFLDALGDPGLRVRVLDKGPSNMEEALRIALNLEALDNSKEVESAAISEKHSRREKFVKTASQEETTCSDTAARRRNDSRPFPDGAIKQLRDSIQQCCSQMAQMQQDVAGLKQWPVPPFQPGFIHGYQYPAAMEHPVQCGPYSVSQPGRLVGPMEQLDYAPGSGTQPSVTASSDPLPLGSSRVDSVGMETNSSSARGGRSGATPQTGEYARRGTARGRGPCHRCGQQGHYARDCPQSSQDTTSGVPYQNRPGKVQVASDKNNQRDVYMPVKLFGKGTVALLDTGCDTSILGSRLLPKGTQLQASTTRLLAANGTQIPLLGELEVKFRVAGKQYSALVVVTEAVDEFILGIDFLSAEACQWDFGDGRLLLGNSWVRLQKRDGRSQVRRIYAAEDCHVPPGVQAEVPVSVTWPNLRSGSDDWVTEPRKMADGVIAARTLFSGETLQSIVRVINLSDEPYNCRKDEQLGEATLAETWTPNRSSSCVTTSVTVPARNAGPVASAGPAGGAGLNAGLDLHTTGRGSGDEYAHVQCLIDGLPSTLTDEQCKEATCFIRNNADVFSKSEYDLGHTDLVEHQIDTGDSPPVRQALRRHPVAYLPLIDQHVSQMVENNIIEPRSGSEWISNVVLVRKKDGSLRYCIDYRGLNAVTQKANYPLPRIDACHDSLGGNTLFSCLDMRSSYWQVKVKDSDVDKTSFVTRKGIFGFKVLPFGLCNAPSTFQRLVDLVLAGLTWEVCLAYLDDLVVFSRTFHEHLERLQLVLSRLKEANLKLKPNKCSLFQTRVKFLGSIISVDGIEPDPEKAQAVAEWPRPRNLTEVRSFVALASYYRRHIQSFAEIARPLHELTKKHARFEWGPRQEDSFLSLKHSLVNAPVLAMPVDGGGFVLDTDANQFSMGCVLQQMQDGLLKVIGYASKAFSEAELRYCTTRRELAAVIYGLKYYRHFLLGFPFVLRTDHAALTHLLRTPNPVAQSARYLDTLAEYQFTLQYRPGLSHRNADAMSRRPCNRELDQPLCKQCGPLHDPLQDEGDLLGDGCEVVNDARAVDREEQFVPGPPNASPTTLSAQCARGADTSENAGPEPNAGLFSGSARCGPSSQVPQLARPANVEVTQPEPRSTTSSDGIPEGWVPSSLSGVSPVTANVLREQQTLDSVIHAVSGWIADPDTMPDRNQLHSLSCEVQHLWAQRQSLTIKSGILYRKFVRPDGSLRYLQVVVPRSLRTQFLDGVHAGPMNGHLGIEKTRLKLQGIAYWQGWSFDALMYVRRCHICGTYRHGPRRKQGQLQRALAYDVMQKVHIDLVGPFCLSKKGFRYLLTVICGFTKYLICVPIRDKHSVSVADALMRHVYLVYNPPEILVHDSGGEFWSDVMRRLATLLDIQPSRITSHRPNSNGVVERVHATLHSMFAKMVDKHQRNWCELTPYVTYAYNTASHSSSTFSPFYLMFLRQARMPFELQMEKPTEAAYETEDEYVTLASERMRAAYDIVRSHLRATFDKAKKRYDDRVKTARFEEGQLVWYYVPRSRKGFCRKWECNNVGAFKVMKKLNDVNCVIKRSPRAKPIIVHIDRLSPYYGDTPKVWQVTAGDVSTTEATIVDPADVFPDVTQAAAAPEGSKRTTGRRGRSEAPPTGCDMPGRPARRRPARAPAWLDSYIRVASVISERSSVLRRSAKMYKCSQCGEGCEHEREMRKHAISQHRMRFDKRLETVLPYATPEMAEVAYLRYRRGQLSAHRRHRLDAGLYVPRYLQEYRRHHVQSSSWSTPQKAEGRTRPSTKRGPSTERGPSTKRGRTQRSRTPPPSGSPRHRSRHTSAAAERTSCEEQRGRRSSEAGVSDHHRFREPSSPLRARRIVVSSPEQSSAPRTVTRTSPSAALGRPPSRSPRASDTELSDLSLSGSELPSDLADLILSAPPFPTAQRGTTEAPTTTVTTRDVSCSVRPDVSDSAAQVSAATRDAAVNAGLDQRMSAFGLLPGFCLRDIITATRQLGVDIGTIVDSLLPTVAPPPSAEQRRRFVDLVHFAAAVRRDHASELVGTVYRLQMLRQTEFDQTAEERRLDAWLSHAQQDAAAWRLDEDLLSTAQPPLWYEEIVTPNTEPVVLD